MSGLSGPRIIAGSASDPSISGAEWIISKAHPSFRPTAPRDTSSTVITAEMGSISYSSAQSALRCARTWIRSLFPR